MAKKVSTLPKTSATPLWKTAPRNKLKGWDVYKRNYFEWGVKAALGRVPHIDQFLKDGNSNSFTAYYKDGYLSTKEVLNKKDSSDEAST